MLTILWLLSWNNFSPSSYQTVTTLHWSFWSSLSFASSAERSKETLWLTHLLTPCVDWCLFQVFDDLLQSDHSRPRPYLGLLPGGLWIDSIKHSTKIPVSWRNNKVRHRHPAGTLQGSDISEDFEFLTWTSLKRYTWKQTYYIYIKEGWSTLKIFQFTWGNPSYSECFHGACV